MQEGKRTQESRGMVGARRRLRGGGEILGRLPSVRHQRQIGTPDTFWRLPSFHIPHLRPSLNHGLRRARRTPGKSAV